jgi:hypothetical protein
MHNASPGGYDCLEERESGEVRYAFYAVDADMKSYKAVRCPVQQLSSHRCIGMILENAERGSCLIDDLHGKLRNGAQSNPVCAVPRRNL